VPVQLPPIGFEVSSCCASGGSVQRRHGMHFVRWPLR